MAYDLQEIADRAAIVQTRLQKRGQNDLHAHVAMFRFRLSESQTISPSVLRGLWSEACSSNDVRVSRIASGFGYGEPGYIYSLWASPHTQDLRAIEVAIEWRLQKLLPAVRIKLTHLR